MNPLTFTRGCVTLPRAIVDEAVAAAAKAYDCAPAEILSLSRKRRAFVARAYAMWLLRQHKSPTGQQLYSFPQIGKPFGRHHTTVINACAAHEARVAELQLAVAA